MAHVSLLVISLMVKSADSSKKGSESLVTNSLPMQQLPDNNVNLISKLRSKAENKLIIANFNINSVSGKFGKLKHIIQNKVDILVLTETKIDFSLSK